MTKVIQKRRPFSPPIQGGKVACQASRDKKTAVNQTAESDKINTSRETWEPQKIARQLARKSDQLHAEKVKQIKKFIAKGEYEIDPREIARSIIRAEMPGQLQKSKVQSMNIVLEALLALTEEEIAAGEKMAAQPGELKDAHRSVGCRRAVQANRCRTKPGLLGFLR